MSGPTVEVFVSCAGCEFLRSADFSEGASLSCAHPKVLADFKSEEPVAIGYHVRGEMPPETPAFCPLREAAILAFFEETKT